MVGVVVSRTRYSESTGSLYEVDGSAVTCTTAWPVPSARRFVRGHGWRPTAASIVLLDPDEPEMPVAEPTPRQLRSGWVTGDAARTRLETTIPLDVRRTIVAFDEEHWALLRFAASSPSALQMMRTNPALAFMLANRKQCRRGCGASTTRQRLPRTLERVPERDALAWFGFPSGEDVVTIVRKVPSSAANVRRLSELREALRNEFTRARLVDLPSVPSCVIDLAHWQQLDRVSDGFVRELLDTAPGWASVMVSAVASAHRYAARAGMAPPPVFESFRSLRLWQKHAERERLRSLLPRLDERLPEAPFPGRERIEPITSLRMLIAEGWALRNRVVRHYEAICDGEAALYRLLAPERATVLVICILGHWILHDVSGRRGAQVEATTFEAVRRWLEDAQGAG